MIRGMWQIPRSMSHRMGSGNPATPEAVRVKGSGRIPSCLARIIHGFHVAKEPLVCQIRPSVANLELSGAGMPLDYVDEGRASTAREEVRLALAAGNS